MGITTPQNLKCLHCRWLTGLELHVQVNKTACKAKQEIESEECPYELNCASAKCKQYRLVASRLYPEVFTLHAGAVYATSTPPRKEE